MMPAKSQAVLEAEAFHNAIAALNEAYGRRLQALMIENMQLRQELMIARGRAAAKEKNDVPPTEPATEVRRHTSPVPASEAANAIHVGSDGADGKVEKSSTGPIPWVEP